MYAAFFGFFLYPFFRDILPYPDVFWTLSILCGIALCLFKFDISTPLRPEFLCWAIIALMAIGSFIYWGSSATILPKRLSLFLICMVMMIVLRRGTCWIKPAFMVAMVCLFVHAVATVAFGAAPSLYDHFIAPIITGSSKTVIGPKAGITSHYSYNGQFVAIGLLMSYTYFRVGRKGCPSFHGKSFAALLMVFVFAIALLMTTKRSPFLICVTLIVLSEYLATPTGKAGKALTILLFVSVAISFLSLVSDRIPAINEMFVRLSAIFGSNSLEESTTGRTYLWDQALSMWQASPLVGSGWGTYRYQWVNGYNGESTAAHNVFLQLLAEVGVVGLVVFLIPAGIAAFGLLKKLPSVLRSTPGCQCDNASSYIAFAALFQLYFFIYCFVGAPLYDFESFPFYFILSCGVWYATEYAKDRTRKLSTSASMKSSGSSYLDIKNGCR